MLTLHTVTFIEYFPSSLFCYIGKCFFFNELILDFQYEIILVLKDEELISFL